MEDDTRVSISQRDFSTLALCAARYAMGRRTYIVDEVCTILETFVDGLGRETAIVMLKDIVTAEYRGDACDRESWAQLAHALRWELRHASDAVDPHASDLGTPSTRARS